MHIATARRSTDVARPHGRRAPGRWMLVPVAVSVVLVVMSLGGIDRPFGPRYENFNTAVWATGARSVQSEGWWEARLGARAERVGYPDAYVHHPPMTQVVASTVGSALGDHRWAYRVAALAFSVAAVWVCWGWLGAARFSPAARSVGVLAAAGTTLLVRYGVMLNMEIVWLPFLFGLLWAWQAAEDDPESRRAALTCGAVAVLGGLAAHQGILLAGALGVAGLLRSRLAHRRPHRHEVLTLAGGALAALLFLGWVVWASGGVQDLWRSAGVRTGALGWFDWAVVQGEHLVLLFGALGTAMLVGGALLVRRRPELWVAAGTVLAVTAAYAAVFRVGALHLYWNASLVALVALGAALVAEWTERSSLPLAQLLVLLCSSTLIAGGRSAGAGPSDDYAAAVVDAGRDQAVVYATVRLSDWAVYESGRRAESVVTCDAVALVARTHPNAMVVTSGQWVRDRAGEPAWASVSGLGAARHGDVAVVAAADLADLAC